MLELQILKYFKYDSVTYMLLARKKPDEWDEKVIEALHRKAKK